MFHRWPALALAALVAPRLLVMELALAALVAPRLDAQVLALAVALRAAWAA
jgi:hypothetical protein